MTRTAGAFARVQGSLSWFLDAYAELASWRATVARLAGFQRAIVVARGLANQGARLRSGAGDGIAAADLALALPDGTPLLAYSGMLFPKGRNTAISGRSDPIP